MRHSKTAIALRACCADLGAVRRQQRDANHRSSLISIVIRRQINLSLAPTAASSTQANKGGGQVENSVVIGREKNRQRRFSCGCNVSEFAPQMHPSSSINQKILYVQINLIDNNDDNNKKQVSRR